MSAPMQTAGLRLDQAPPLSIPVTFFLSAPLAVAAAGAMLLVVGSYALLSNWMPQTLALTHLGTLGFLLMVMMGALYQVTPVIAGSRVRWVRLAHTVHALFVVGLSGLVWGLFRSAPRITFASLALLLAALLLFLIPVGIALFRAPTRNETVTGMRLAFASLLLVGFLGLWMAHGHSGMRFPGPRGLWIQVHLSVGLLGWVGGLISAVSWQVLPMFYLAAPFGRRSKRATLVLLFAGVLLSVAVLFLDLAGVASVRAWGAPRLAALGALPAAFAAWGLQPALALHSLALRQRRRVDGSLRFWQAGLVAAFLAAGASLATVLLLDPRWGVLLGWIAIWGWAGMIVHGMLTRIVPFLVWFHRFAPLVGRAPVPPLRRLLPDRWTRLGLALHLASLLAGIAAIASGRAFLARLTGLLLVATATQLAHSLVHVLRQRPAEGTEGS